MQVRKLRKLINHEQVKPKNQNEANKKGTFSNLQQA